MSATREILVPRIHCPLCGGTSHRVYGKREECDGDIRRYVRCLDCGTKFHTLETDSGMFNHVETRYTRVR